MLRPATRYILIVFGVAALWLATSTTAMEYLWAKKKGDKWWSADRWTKGNLVGMSHLDFVDKFISPTVYPVHKPGIACNTKNAVLYICGDSYSWSFQEIQFAGIAGYHYINRYQGGRYGLDTTKNNILIIEVGERLVKDYFEGTRIINELYDSAKGKPIAGIWEAPSPANVRYASFPFKIDLDLFFNKRINQNLENLLFNTQFLMPVFRSKAALNYYFFNRASGDVVISKDRNFLFDKGSVATEGSGAYAPLAAGDIDGMVHNLNTIYARYKADGFKEVYLSMIPSTPAIVDSEGYNHLIPGIQSNPALKMPVIDVYSEFKDHGNDYFSHGDTHWSIKGEQKWIDMVNTILINHQGPSS